MSLVDLSGRVCVSVVMPSLNQRQFLSEAIRSVLEQDVDALELVVVDGGSTDGSLDVLAALAAEYAGRLRWSSAPDAGPASAINKAVSEARGPVVGWLNSDDLYRPGAVAQAVRHFAEHGEDVMVYGHAEHVDVGGAVLGPYPTLPPTTPLHAFRNGCFICQPSVFFRREVFLALGGLLTSLRTAFDFEFWLRLFKAYPGRVAFIPAVLARSRLHVGGITLRMREQVALEGLQVINQHIGPAPAHWLWTHIEELFAGYPFAAEPFDLQERLSSLIDRARSFVTPDELDDLNARLEHDQRLALSRPTFFATIHADGWAGPVLDLRVRQPPQGQVPFERLRLRGRHAAPGGQALRLRVSSPDGSQQQVILEGNGTFELELAIPDLKPQARVIFRVECKETWQPAQRDGDSGDTRELAFRLECCELVVGGQAS